MVHLDRTNLRLIDALQRDARTSVAELARNVKLAESSVRERLLNLERSGVIRGYRAQVDFQKLGYTTHALIRAECSPGDVQEISRQLGGVPQVTNAILTTGAKPLLMELWVEDLSRLEQVLENRLTGLPLRSIESAVVLQSMVEPRSASLERLVAGLNVLPLRAATPPRLALPGESNLTPASRPVESAFARAAPTF